MRLGDRLCPGDAETWRYAYMPDEASTSATSAPTPPKHLQSTSVLDVDAALDAIGCGSFHFWTVTAISLFVVAQSIQTNLLAFLPPCAGAAFGVDPDAAALIASASFGASCITTPLFGACADAFGRRTATLRKVIRQKRLHGQEQLLWRHGRPAAEPRPFRADRMYQRQVPARSGRARSTVGPARQRCPQPSP